VSEAFELATTKTRMALLVLVRDRKIRLDPNSMPTRYEHVETRTNLTARTVEAIRAGWVRDSGTYPHLTVKGTEVLTAFEGRQQR
jgi:hypothetical protein